MKLAPHVETMHCEGVFDDFDRLTHVSSLSCADVEMLEDFPRLPDCQKTPLSILDANDVGVLSDMRLPESLSISDPVLEVPDTLMLTDAPCPANAAIISALPFAEAADADDASRARRSSPRTIVAIDGSTVRCIDHHVATSDLLGIATLGAAPPSCQLHVATSIIPAIRRAELLVVNATQILHTNMRAAQDHYWNTSIDPLPTLYRRIRALEWPQLHRAPFRGCVDNPGSKGATMGLRLSSPTDKAHGMRPYIATFSSEHTAVLREACALLRSAHPDFPFLAMAVVLDARTALHVDINNAGPSMAIFFGPTSGGQLWQSSPDLAKLVAFDTGVWQYTDGRLPHSVLPFAGQRVGLVAYLPSFSHWPLARPL